MQRLASPMLARLARQLDLAEDRLSYVGGFENLVYRLNDSPDRIVRLTHDSHRSRDQLLAEIAWVGFLAGRGLPVARALQWPSGRPLEPVEGPDGELWHAATFEVAPGQPVSAGDESVWCGDLFEAWGELLGRMHQATRDWHPPADRTGRPHWHEDGLLGTADALGDAHADIVGAGRRVIAAVAALDATHDTYGLVHGDLHHGNFFVDAGRLTAFDFDDASYHYRAHDLAMAVYYACWHTAEGDQAEQDAFAERFMGHLLRGYRRHAEIGADELATIPRFLALRDYTLYLAIHDKLDVDALDGPLAAALAERRARLLGGGSPIGIDFGAL